MKIAKYIQLTKSYRLTIFLMVFALVDGAATIAEAANVAVAAEPLLLLKTGGESDLIVDRQRQLIYSADNCRNQQSFRWIGDSSNPDQAVRRLKVESAVSQNLAGKPLTFSLNYEMEIAGDRVRLFVQTMEGAIELPVASSTYNGRRPCR